MAQPHPPHAPEAWEIESKLEAFLGGQDPQEIKPVPWPTRPGKTVGLRPLVRENYKAADAVARKWGTETGIPHVAAMVTDPITGMVRPWTMRDDSEVARAYLDEIVAAALVDPETGARICPGGGAELRRLARPETVKILGDQLADWTEQTSPPEPQFETPEQLDRILDSLGKEPGATPLEACGPSMLRALLRRSVAPRQNSTGSTSSTSTPDGKPAETPTA